MTTLPTPAVANAAPKLSIPTPALLLAMLQVAPRVSDLIFSPGSLPLVEVSGQLVPVKIQGLQALGPDDTWRIAEELMSGNKQAAAALQQQGSCDLSYSLPGQCRFRVNVFIQRGSHAIVMRVIPKTAPTFAELKLPPQLGEIANLKNGIVLVTGPTGSGKSSTMAAILDRINETQAYHIITIEDPVEFVHRHKKSIIHQRELHSDTPSFTAALRAALRQAPKVILVGEMRDKDTIEIAMEAAETGHLVLSTLHTIDASKTVERVVGAFPLAEQQIIRTRLAKSFRYVISQRLVPQKQGGRVAIIEILTSTLRTREYVEKGENEGKTLLDAMRTGETEGMQDFDGSIEKLVRDGVIDLETGLAYATNPGNLRLCLADLSEEGLRAAAPNLSEKKMAEMKTTEKAPAKPAERAPARESGPRSEREPEMVIE
ncbi:MAG: PilT/PilU family type 4a pilus ATPase [Terriglobales bacterium]